MRFFSPCIHPFFTLFLCRFKKFRFFTDAIDKVWHAFRYFDHSPCHTFSHPTQQVFSTMSYSFPYSIKIAQFYWQEMSSRARQKDKIGFRYSGAKIVIFKSNETHFAKNRCAQKHRIKTCTVFNVILTTKIVRTRKFKKQKKLCF